MNAVYLTLEKAVAICQQKVRPVADTKVKLERAVGRICAGRYQTVRSIPDFDRSRVDGYAVHRQDILTTSHPWLRLSLAGSIKAGDYVQLSMDRGETWRVMTGAMLPLGCGAVVKQEEVESNWSDITINKPIIMEQNIEKIGSTMTAGAELASVGQRLTVLDIEKLASAGFASINVYQRPAVYLIQTGDELVMPGHDLPAGKIYTSNRSQFFALLLSRGAKPVAGAGPAGDRIEWLTQEIIKAENTARLVIMTGGTQQGDYDVVPAALYKAKARQLFAGLDARPGHRTSAWLLNDSLIINVPGHPGAGYLLFHGLIRPVLNHLSGLKPADEKWLTLPFSQTSFKPLAHRTLTEGVLIPAGDGNLQLVPPGLRSGQPGWKVIVDVPAAGQADLRCLPVNGGLA